MLRKKNQNKIFNHNDYILLIAGIVGVVLAVYGLIFQTRTCDSTIYGVKTNDTVIVGIAIALCAILYKHIGKFIRAKYYPKEK